MTEPTVAEALAAEMAARPVLKPATVKVGDGVTYCIGSDRYPGTVTSVSASGLTIGFTMDDYTATPQSNYYGSQEYTYSSVEPVEWVNPLGEPQTNVRTARWSVKKGGYRSFGTPVVAGRRAYQDPSF